MVLLLPKQSTVTLLLVLGKLTIALHLVLLELFSQHALLNFVMDAPTQMLLPVLQIIVVPAQ
jgi:hypothetical protein